MFRFLKKNNISMKFIHELNENTIDYINSKGEKYFFNKNNKIIVEKLDSIEDIVQKINENGIVVIPNILDTNYCQKLEDFIVKTISIYKDKLNNNLFFEDENVLIQQSRVKLTTYKALKNYAKSVINIRKKEDKGMIDIFNIDKLNSELFKEIKEFTKSNFWIQLFSKLDINISLKNINTYVNDGIINTRGFHADSYNKQYKVFFYLTDVLSLNDGPYTYVIKTHKKTPYREINQIICSYISKKTETPILPYKNIHPILGYKGSLIISNQAGFHRGFPQDKNSHRVILVLNMVDK